ncbi:hypothetical protein D3C87_1851240 [compost metagenome]
MEHQRDAHGLEAAPGQFGPVGAGRGGQGVAAHVGEAHAGALHHGAAFQNAGAAIAAQALGRWLFPFVGQEWLAVHGGNGVGDAVLQAEQVGADCLGVDHDGRNRMGR